MDMVVLFIIYIPIVLSVIMYSLQTAQLHLEEVADMVELFITKTQGQA